MKVVASQLETGLDKGANTAVALAVVEAAADAGADLVVLPEATMCGFGEPGRDLSGDAETLDGPFASAMTEVAARTGIFVVAGMFEQAPGDGHVYNTVLATGPSGPVGAYRKLHLFDALGWRESDRVEAGDPRRDEPLVFDVADLRVGVMNCYDLRFPEMARTLVDRGATVLLEPANWIAGPGKADVFATLLRARAIENTCYVVAAAKPAPECAGGSCIVDPLGAVLTQLGEDERGAVEGDLRPERVAEVRRELPVLEHRRFAVISR